MIPEAWDALAKKMRESGIEELAFAPDGALLGIRLSANPPPPVPLPDPKLDENEVANKAALADFREKSRRELLAEQEVESQMYRFAATEGVPVGR